MHNPVKPRTIPGGQQINSYLTGGSGWETDSGGMADGQEDTYTTRQKPMHMNDVDGETERHIESNTYSARERSALFLAQRTKTSSVSSAAWPCQMGASCSPSDVLGPTWVNHPTDPRKPRTVSIINNTPARAARQVAPHMSPWPDMGEPPDRPEETSDCISPQPFI